jgi:putative Mg2+ transporter-C (MgtC) family protein
MSLVDAAHLSNAEIIARLAVSLGVGSALGLQRELDGQEAGLRTHALLALGAGVFGVVSVAAFTGFISDSTTGNVQIDVTRIASYVAAGVGFLAGGAIVKGTTRVRGLTTAASLWVCSAVGLAAGLGLYSAAIAGTVAGVILLALDRPLSGLKRTRRRVALHVKLSDEDALGQLMAAVLDADGAGMHPNVTSHRVAAGVEVDVSGIPLTIAKRLITQLSAMPTIDEVRLIQD